jgi:alginate O-acetyltransferase complex protein AlgI
LLLIVGITGNLTALGFFKYTNFIATVLPAPLGAIWPHNDLGLPLGISFFSLTQLAFLCDAYAGKVKSAPLQHYLLFVTWFPHLIAGPLLRHQEVMSQFARLERRRCMRPMDGAAALTLFAFGLFKKVILADHIAPFADTGFVGLFGHGPGRFAAVRHPPALQLR